jgi:hypothetical protein
MLGASNVSSSSLPYLSICNVDRTTDSQAHHAAIERSSLIHIDYFVLVLYRRETGHNCAVIESMGLTKSISQG